MPPTDAPVSPDPVDELAAAFARDGVVCVRRLFGRAEVAAAAEVIEAVMERPGPHAKVASGPEDPGRFFEDFVRWQELPALEELAVTSSAAAVAARLLGGGAVRFYHDHVLVKEGGTEQRTPWHQDQPYYNVDGRGVSAWIPVDPVPRPGSLELLAGSHHGPWYLPRTFLAKEAKWFPEGSLAELPDLEAGRDGLDIRSFELAPGDAVFFDFLTVHGAPGFPFSGRRRVLSLRYLSAGARHAPRPWATSPPFEGLEAELAAGAAMDHPLFPLVSHRSSPTTSAGE
ncbi:MAG TPA: phytanoyl-CoA dioxygenase family protein [Acidimicrobiales bacterium]|nr:phytanoyl-CoA dioxygenase family protein [Acidimicrobiales bacterium]